MGERTIEYERTDVRTVTRTIDICDKCGLLPDTTLVPLYTSMTRVAYMNDGAAEEVFSNPLLDRVYEGVHDGRPVVVNQMRTVVEPGMAVVFERRMKHPAVEVCEDCWEEMFGWTTTED